MKGSTENKVFYHDIHYQAEDFVENKSAGHEISLSLESFTVNETDQL